MTPVGEPEERGEHADDAKIAEPTAASAEVRIARRTGPIKQAPPAGSQPTRRTVAEMIRAARFDDLRRNRLLLVLLGVSLLCVILLVIWSIRSQAAIDRMRRDMARTSGRGRLAEDKSGERNPPSESSYGRLLYQKYRKGI